VATAAKPATIRDVARRAGVSTATVSRALGGGAGVDPDTRARVRTAARELRYRPSGVARSLKLRATQTIGLIVTDIENPFFPHLVRAVEDAARAHDYSVILADGRRDPEREIQSLEVLAGRQVDGLLIASTALSERHHDWIAERPCPLVALNTASPAPGVPAVLPDNAAGGRLAAEHLLELGHERLAYVGAAATLNVAVTERLAGAKAAIALRPVRLEMVEGDGSVEGGEAAAREAVQRFPGTTGLVCYNDLTAVGALRGVRSLGLRVPTDVSIVGFDDIELAPYVDPPLTTVRQAVSDMGVWAVERLLAAIAGEEPADDATVTQRVGVDLVVRGSTAPPPALGAGRR
jgi:DNA-binding LacI/PurR family transcriptional regulator